jgi:glycosyltransferase domain-containing protein
MDDPAATVVIPTYNRPKFLAQLLGYFRQQNLRHYVLVSDSSQPPTSDTNRKIVDEIGKDLQIRYMQFDPQIGLASKLAETLGTVSSKYSVICADDDFLVPTALEECVRFLEANPDFELAHGCYMHLYAVELREGYVVGWRQPVAGVPRSNLWAQRQVSRTIQNEDPFERLKEFLLTEVTTFYAVYRSHNQLRSMRIAATMEKDTFFMEQLATWFTPIQGKLKHLDLLFSVKPFHPVDASRRDPTRLDLPDLVTSDCFSERYARFRSYLAEELAKVAEMPDDEARRNMDQAFLAFMADYLYRFTKPQSLRDRPSRVSKLGKIAGSAVISVLRDRRLIDMVKGPMEFAVTSFALSGNYRPLDSFLRRYGVGADFEPVLRWILQPPVERTDAS